MRQNRNRRAALYSQGVGELLSAPVGWSVAVVPLAVPVGLADGDAVGLGVGSAVALV